MRSNPGNLWKPLGIAGVVVMLSLVAGVAVGVYVGTHPNAELDPPNPIDPLPPSDSPMGVYYNAAVAANSYPCNLIGRDVLLDGGNAVDAAIATLFCDGVSSLQSMGLGGGFFMTIYNGTTKEAFALNAREVAPGAAYEDMFEGNSTLSQLGGLSVAVPSELKGYWELYQRFGSLPWARLIQPTIDLCESGIDVGPYLASRIKQKEAEILASPTIRELLTDAEGNLLTEGGKIYHTQLAETLRVIANEGGDALYTGSLVQDFVSDIQALGGIITLQDMADYQVRWQTPVSASLSNGYTAYTLTSPASGAQLIFMLNILDGFIPAADEITTYQRIAETIKYAYGARTHLGDPDFVDVSELLSNLTSKDYASFIRSRIEDDRTYNDPAHYFAETLNVENHGTAHISIIDKDGSSVSVTSTINLVFGSVTRSLKTGIILNDEMDDFSAPNITNSFGVPPSPENFIAPGKIPLSSMCPLIVTDANGDVVLSVGASGGTKITSSVIQTALRNLWLNQNIKEAIDAPRIHHQVYPMELKYEYGNVDRIVKGLEAIGHVTSRYTGGSAVNGVARDGQFLTANSDYRRDAVVAGY
ncbi:Hypothetical predicted protein [Cloeon dipterum]|uniref:Gamma-glutamyltransferase n=1 Tax=Cloeon dipterum TaxID=197152 RepID=A0A8S1BY97_9INSE|nr:Hypothetical predicted protein [Cloeon dipterum]